MMKKFWTKCKWPLIIFLNMLPFALNILFYRIGGMYDCFFFIPFFTGLALLNYFNCRSVISYLLIQALMLACIIGSGCASTHLYFNNISNDDMTPIVGMLIVFFESAINITTTGFLIIVKVIVNRINRSKQQVPTAKVAEDSDRI